MADAEIENGEGKWSTNQGQEIGGVSAELAGKGIIEGAEIFEIDEEEARVLEEALSVREVVVAGFEVSDEFLELLEEGVIGGAGFRFGAAAVVP